MIRDTLEERVFLYDSYVKYGSASKCGRKFRDERVPSRQTIHNLVNKLRTSGHVIDKKQKHNASSAEEKVGAIGG
jgi:hypothetical protein